MKNKLLLLVLLFPLTIFSQDVYIISEENEISILNNDYSISHLTNILIESDIIPGLIDQLTDFAISPSNIFYGVTSESRLIEFNINDGSYTIIDVLNGDIVSLVCSNNNELFYLKSDQLYKYNLDTNIEIFIVNIGLETPGDLTFYKGNIIFKDKSTKIIKAFNLQNNSLSNIFCLPNESFNFYGLTNVFENCDLSKILGSNNNKIYELDFENNLLIDLDIIVDDDFVVFGLASTNEYLSSNCDFFQFQNIDCNTISVNDINYFSKLNIYPNPTKNKINIQTKDKILIVEIYDVLGKQVLKKENPNLTINASKLKKGLYFIKVKSNYWVKTKSFLKE